MQVILSVYRHLTAVDTVAVLQDIDRPQPTVLNRLITMIYVDNDVRNHSLFVVTVAR